MDDVKLDFALRDLLNISTLDNTHMELIERFMKSLDAPNLLRVQHIGRAESSWSAAAIAKFNLPAHVLGLLSFNRNGHIREESLRRLSKIADDSALPYLLIGAGDWVAPVRAVAEKAIAVRLATTRGKAFVQNLSLLGRLSATERMGTSDIRHRIEEILASEDNENLMLDCVKSGDKAARRYAFAIMLNQSEQHARDRAIKAALASNDCVLRMKAADAALWFFESEELEIIVPELLQDSYAPLRLEAMRWAVKNNLRRWPTVVSNAIADSNAAVRLYARYVMRELDHRELYLQRLQKDRDVIASLRGLIEIKADVEPALIERFINHSNAQIRAAAYGLLFRIDPFNCFKLINAALNDKSNYCTREANKFLREHAETLPADTFIELLTRPLQCENITALKHDMLALRTLMTAVIRLPKWTSLSVILSAKNGPPQIQERVDRVLSNWLAIERSAGGTCPGDRVDELREKLELLESQGAIDAQAAKQLHFALK